MGARSGAVRSSQCRTAAGILGHQQKDCGAEQEHRHEARRHHHAEAVHQPVAAAQPARPIIRGMLLAEVAAVPASSDPATKGAPDTSAKAKPISQTEWPCRAVASATRTWLIFAPPRKRRQPDRHRDGTRERRAGDRGHDTRR
jgi:hypothetical protein